MESNSPFPTDIWPVAVNTARSLPVHVYAPNLVDTRTVVVVRYRLHRNRLTFFVVFDRKEFPY